MVPAGAETDGGEGGLDGVDGAEVDPLLGREVVEGEQAVAVLDQAVHRLGVLGLENGDEVIEGIGGLVPRRCQVHLVVGGRFVGLLFC